jgi:ribulose-phosphate 3-epimerase
MDGIFVNNISYGIPVLQAVRKCTDIVLDVHLMILEPLKYIKLLQRAGQISLHFILKVIPIFQKL